MRGQPAGLVLAAAAAAGTYLLWTAGTPGWRAPHRPRVPGTSGLRPRAAQWLAQAGLEHVRPVEFVTASALLATVGGLIAYGLFGTALPALVAGGAASIVPVATHRRRREVRMHRAQEAWPRLIEEIRMLTGSQGRSIPQALFDVGDRGPIELRPAFAAARREWLLSTDFERTVEVLKARLADPTADAACETLLVAHDLGGADLDRRLLALAVDRSLDVQGRRDARARQAGVRFARRFVLFVPLGMAVAGLSIGDGRAAYATPAGQLLVAVALAAMAGCWLWAGRLLRLPGEARVFGR